MALDDNSLPGFNPGIDTTIAAAQWNKQRNGSQRLRVALQFYKHPQGLTDEEAGILAKIRPQSCPWKRAGELREMGILRLTDKRRNTESGSPARVSVPTELGWRLMAEKFDLKLF